MKNIKHMLVIAAVLVALLISGCASVGKADLDNAKDALDKNSPSEAIVFATEALLQDPKFEQAKDFIRDHTEDALKQINAFLAKSEGTKEPETAEKRYDMYQNLVAFYSNLKEIGLPIVKGKKLFGLIKGWEWSIPIKDYTAQLKEAGVYAHKVFFDSGTAAVQSGNLDRAESLFNKTINKFAIGGPEGQKSDKEKISGIFTSWAKQAHGSSKPDTLLQSIKAYQIALKFNNSNQEASSGLEKAKTELSDVYLALGLKEEEKNTIESLKEALNYFDLSLKYNKDNKPASESIPRVKHQIAVLYTEQGEALANKGTIDEMLAAHKLYEEALKWDASYQKATDNIEAITGRIAEHYYQEGNKLTSDLKDDKALKAAVAAYDNAQKWIPNYKDTEVRKKRVFVSRELIVCEGKLETTNAEVERTNSRVVALSGQVNKGHKGINDLFYVTDKVIQLDGQMRAVKSVMKPLGFVPMVGTVITTIGTSLEYVHKPVSSVSSKIKRVQKPYITPSREMIGKVKTQVDQVVNTMAQTKSSIQNVQTAVRKINGCIAKLEDPAVIAEVEKDVKEINKALDALNKGLDTVNDVQDQTEGTLKALADSVSVINSVTGGIKTIMGPLDKIDSVTSEINKVLKKRIKIPFVGSFTVEDAIDSSTGVVQKAAKKLLNPVLDKLNIKIPSIPGIDQLDGILDKVEGYYNDIKSAEAKINKATSEILDIPQRLQNEVNDIASKTGCSL